MLPKRLSGSLENGLDLSVALGIFLFYSLMLSLPRGYNYGAVILLVGGIATLFRRQTVPLTLGDRTIIFLLLAVFCVGVFSFFYHNNPLRSLDLTSRYLLTIPIFYLLITRRPDIRWVWSGVAIGCVSASGIALWETDFLGMERADGSTGGIQFGNLALMMAVFSFVGSIQVHRELQKRAWSYVLLLSSIAGLYASIASGSRGGWIALPFIGLVLLTAYTTQRNLYQMVTATLILGCVAIGAFFTVPMIELRFDQAVTDIERYLAGEPYTSIGQRLAMYEALAVMIPQRPWFGWGTEEFTLELARLAEHGVVSDAALGLANAHNSYLEIWAHQGVMGVVPIVALIVVSFAYFMRYIRSEDPRVQAAASCGASLVVGYAIFSLSQVMLARNNTLLFFLLSLSVFWALTKRPPLSQKNAIKEKKPKESRFCATDSPTPDKSSNARL